jgi:hypothetical protein
MIETPIIAMATIKYRLGRAGFSCLANLSLFAFRVGLNNAQ